MDLKSKVGPITAVVILSATTLWMMGVDDITQAQHATDNTETTSFTPKVSTEEVIRKQVQAQALTESLMSDSLSLSGITQPSKSLDLTAGLAGKIQKIHIKKGQFITKGGVIAAIDTRALEAQIIQESALVKQRQMQLDSISQLQQDNYSSAINKATAETDLATAKANLRALQIDLENSKLIAPFSGVLNTLEVEEGQLIPQNEVIGKFVSINPLSVEINVPQKQFTRIDNKLSAEITLSTGQTAKGSIKYISAVADSETRSILIEFEIINEKNAIPAGITATVKLILPEQKAHSFSAALLTLDDNGATAVKLLNLDNEVVLAPVQVLRSERDKVWVKGLPPNINLITVGQGFTNVGDVVDAFYKKQ